MQQGRLDQLDAQQLEEQLPFFLRRLFERLGSTYIKLGQFIASSPTLFPAPYVEEFQKCLDSTEKIPFEKIKVSSTCLLTSEFGPIETG
jgi:aarF domain-containing kinase